MIEINLLPGPKKKKSAAAGLAISFDGVKELFAKVKDPMLIGSVAAWGLALAFVAFFYLKDARELTAQQQDLDRVEAESRRFAALIAQKRKAEQLRDSLITELNVIRGIDGDRYVWPHILEEVTRALPDYTWLVGVEVLGAARPGAPPSQQQPAAATEDSTGVKQVRFSVEGRTSDVQAYTRFLRQLSNSPWIRDIVAGATTTAIEENRPVTAFSLTATYQRADSSFIRTAPVLQQLR
jgi:Tfp pilus assembly protein PilN